MPQPEHSGGSPQRRTDVISLESSTERFFGREVLYRTLLNALPAAIYTTDAEGRITFFNDAAAQFAGRRPELGELWCVTWRLYNLDGSPLPHDQCPMAVTLKERRPIRGAEAVAERPDGSRITFVPYPTPLFDDDGGLVGAVNMLVDITERKRAEDHQRRLVHEVNHRANNVLTVVQSLIRLTRGDDVGHYRARLEGRIAALARSHNLLAQSQWVGADLRSLVFDELAPYMGDDPRIWVSGEAIPLAPAAAQAFALMVHELAANAAKFGAMSAGAGRVFIDWRRDPDDGALLFRWREEGALAPEPPRRSGLGAEVIARIARQHCATLDYDWTSVGLNVQLRAPAEEVIADAAAPDLGMFDARISARSS